ncbi:MAG: GTPase Era [Bacteroidetes bacterium]|nr:MAG: GTPase Era [Bacteroidota bacterium]
MIEIKVNFVFNFKKILPYLCTVFKTAFITILGLPNAGKSTFLNAALGEDLVITNPKAQTTRHRIKGILNDDNYQLVFSDTPGIIKESAYKLQEAMMGAVNESLEDADMVLLILDGQYPKVEEFEAYRDKVKCPFVIAMNKVDLVQDQEKLQDNITKVKEYFNTELVFAVSAKENFNVDGIIKTLVDLAPEHPAFYDKESISDENVRFLVSEMIREQILTQFKKEIPYSVEVSVTEYNEKEKLDEIYATVFVERDSQRGIMLGRGGSAIKNLGIASRKRIEAFIKKKIFLSLSIKVKKDWRKDDQQLQYFGYIKK